MTFFDIDRWNEIWQTITRNKKRSIMTALGVFWGIFMLIIMLGAGLGLGRLFRSQLGDMSTNMVLMQSYQTAVPYKGMPSGRWWEMDNDDVSEVKKLAEVKYVSGVYWSGDFKCAHGDKKGDYTLMGYSPDYQKINPQKIIHGRFINDIDILQKRKVCVIGTQMWKDLFPGGEDPSGKVIKVGSSYFTVIGVMKRQGSMISFSDVERTLVVPISLAQQMRGDLTVHMLAVAGHDGIKSKAVQDACRLAIYARHIVAPTDEKAIWSMSAADFLDQIMNLLYGISLLTWVVGLGTLFAGIIGISNIMLVLVKERTQEIGVRRALGAPPIAIISQILSESFILTFIAGVMGLVAAVGVLSVVDNIYYQQAVVASDMADISWQISFTVGMISLGILVLGSLLAGMIPAGRALKIKAVDAIREE